MQPFLLAVALLLSIKSPASKDPSMPQTPTRHAVVQAMNSVTSAVRACADGQNHGLAQVRLVFRGSDGAVVSTSWQPRPSDRISLPVQACILNAAQGARVPPFRAETFSVSYPFRL